MKGFPWRKANINIGEREFLGSEFTEGLESPLFSVNFYDDIHGSKAKNLWIFNPYLLLVLRFILAAVFIYAAFQKIGRPLAFGDEIRMYGILQRDPCVSITAIALPWIELFVGISLVTGVFMRGAAFILLCLNAVFIIFVSMRTAEAMEADGISFTRVCFDCGCGFGVVCAWQKILEDCLMLVASFILMVAPVHRFVINMLGRGK
jgi:uncharacterized membrane protein YphA (DoxX/SURF4 family)